MKLNKTLILLAATVVSTAASALDVFIDQNASYRYVNATAATSIGAPPANWFTYGFNDTSWTAGSGPFSSNGPSTFGADLGNVNAPFAPGATQPIPSSFTQWDVNYDPYVRYQFNLAAPTALTLWMAVDNGIQSIYLNGVSTTVTFNAEGQAFRWEHVLDIAADYTFSGLNVLALQLEDHGGATAFDMMLTSNDAAINTPFTTNAPPVPPRGNVPEPASIALVGLALASLATRRRR